MRPLMTLSPLHYDIYVHASCVWPSLVQFDPKCLHLVLIYSAEQSLSTLQESHKYKHLAVGPRHPLIIQQLL